MTELCCFKIHVKVLIPNMTVFEDTAPLGGNQS